MTKVRDRENIPTLIKWQFLFYREGGNPGRTKTMRGFIKFIKKNKFEKFTTPDNGAEFCLTGEVLNHEHFPDGNAIITTKVKGIFKDEDDDKLLIMDTENGFFYAHYEDINKYMQMLIEDILSLRGLLRKKGIYVPPYIVGSRFL